MKKIIAAAAAVLLSGMAFAQDISLEVGGRASFDLNIFDFKHIEDMSKSEILKACHGMTEEKLKLREKYDDDFTGLERGDYDHFMLFGKDMVDSLQPKPGFGVNAFVNIGFPIGIGIQPEVGFHYHTAGLKLNDGRFEISGVPFDFRDKTNKPNDEYYDAEDPRISYMTLDVPILVTYKINIGDTFFIRPAVGPKISFTLGKVKLINEYECRDDFYSRYDYDDNGKPKKLGSYTESGSDIENLDVKSPFNFGISAGVGFGINLGGGALIIDARYNRDFTKMKYEVHDIEVELGSPQSIEISVGYSVKVM